jgi:hypothetical protein
MRVKVWNDDFREWNEMFKDEPIKIAAHGYIEMSKAEANQLVSQYSPVARDGRGEDIRPKKLRIEMDPEEYAEHVDQPLKYTALDGKQFRTTQGLKNYEAKMRIEVSDDKKRTKGSQAA